MYARLTYDEGSRKDLVDVISFDSKITTTSSLELFPDIKHMNEEAAW
jgi:hypothetical protein